MQPTRQEIEQVYGAFFSKLNDKEKEHIYVTIDALVRDFNAKKAYS
jgi:hypothetical protein